MVKNVGFAGSGQTFKQLTGVKKKNASKQQKRSVRADLAAGNDIQPINTPVRNTAPRQPNTNYAAPPVPPQGDVGTLPQEEQTVDEALINQSVDLTNAGGEVLNNPNLGVDPTLAAGNQLTQGGFQDLDAARNQASQVQQQSADILARIPELQAAADEDISNYFSGQPLDDTRSRLAALNASNLTSGRANSRSGNEIDAELQRGLIRDQANARLTSNNQFRQAELGERNNARQATLNIASLLSGQGLNQATAGVNANLGAGNLANQTTQLGANIFNQGFQNQLGALNFVNDAAMQKFTLQNQLLQQILANVQGSKQNKQSMDLMRQQLEMQNQGGSGIWGKLGTAALGAGVGALTGGLGTAAAGAIAGAMK